MVIPSITHGFSRGLAKGRVMIRVGDKVRDCAGLVGEIVWIIRDVKSICGVVFEDGNYCSYNEEELELA